SLAHTRDKILEYLREPLAQNRSKLQADIHDMEGATMERGAQILTLMKPPLDIPRGSERSPRMFELTLPGLANETDVRYLVQLPLEYDPLRHYPTIVSLPDSGIRP